MEEKISQTSLLGIVHLSKEIVSHRFAVTSLIEDAYSTCIANRLKHLREAEVIVKEQLSKGEYTLPNVNLLPKFKTEDDKLAKISNLLYILDKKQSCPVSYVIDRI